MAASVDAVLQRRAERLGSAIAGCGEALAALRDLFDASEQVTAEEFGLFAERARRRHPGVMAIAWAPAQPGSAAGCPPSLSPVLHVTPRECAAMLRDGVADVHDTRQRGLGNALATGRVEVSASGVSPPDRDRAPIAELWLPTGAGREPPGGAGHFGLLLAVVDLGALLGPADAGGTSCVLSAGTPGPPVAPARSLPVLQGLWSLVATPTDPADAAGSPVAPVQWGVAAGVGWSLFTLVLVVAARAFRREGQRHQSRLTDRVMASLTDGVVVADRAGRLLAANAAATRLLSSPPADGDVARWFAAGRLVDPVRGTPDPPQQTPLARALAGLPLGEVVRMQPPGVAHDARWFAIAAHPLCSVRGAPDGAVVVVRDVTARHRQAERLERLSRAVDQTADMVLITARDGRVLYVNPAFTTLTGHAREDVLGRAGFLRSSGFYGNADFARLRRCLLRGERFRGAVACGRKDGSAFATEQTITPLRDDAGRVTNAVVVCKDMTEHNRLLASDVELQIAAAVQRRLFPRTPPAVAGLDVAGATSPATLTSGDSYDWVLRPSGALALVVGDASGHGLGPALLVSEVHAFLRCLLAMPLTLAQVLDRVHELLAPDLPDDGFVTLLLAEVDPGTRQLRWANAGHEPGLLLAAGREPVRLVATGPALGVLGATPVYGWVEGPRLDAGQVLVMTTDGVTEHAGPDGSRLGEAGLVAWLAEVVDRPAAEIVAHLGARLHAGAAGPQRDDATVLVARATSR